MGRPQRKKAKRSLQNVEVLPADPAPPPQQTSQEQQETTLAASPEVQRSVDETRNQPKPATVTPASGESEMAQTSEQYRRRRARGIRTSSQGVTGRARVERKTLLGQ
jgi:acyl-CoA thioesterase